MKRRELLLGLAGAGVVTKPRPVKSLTDGQTIWIGEREFAATDILAPTPDSFSRRASAGADIVVQALKEILAAGALIEPEAVARDRWGRISGPIYWRTNKGETTTIQAALVERGAARVAPQSADYSFIENLIVRERMARLNAIGLWRLPAFAVKSALSADRSYGFQIYAGSIRSVSERAGRVFFNFGDDYRTDFTATVLASKRKRWRNQTPLQAYTRLDVEIRGQVEWINGPSIELHHEMQMLPA